MSWWPWTSVARLSDAKEQIDWLRAENKELTDALVRLQRFQSGMTETPREPRKKLEPMPEELQEHFEAMERGSIRKHIMDGAWRRARSGEPWAKIAADLMRPPEDLED